MLPDLFSDSTPFDKVFDATRNIFDQEKLRKIAPLLEPLQLRRHKEDAVLELPPKVETKVYVPLTAVQLDLYKKLLAREVDPDADLMVDEKSAGATASLTRLQGLFMQLRKLCNHPNLVLDDNNESVSEIVDSCGKLKVLDKLLRKLKVRGVAACVNRWLMDVSGRGSSCAALFTLY